MLAASAPLRPAKLWLGVGVLVSCASSPHAPLVGVSDAVPEPAPLREPAPAPRVAWPDLEAARAWPEAAPAWPALAHRRDGSLVHVRVDPASHAAYLELAVDSPMPAGARVIAWHETPAGRVLDGYLLEKRSGSWSASVIDERGALVPGSHAACLRCHDMAPADHLFGRRSAPPAAAPQESIDARVR